MEERERNKDSKDSRNSRNPPAAASAGEAPVQDDVPEEIDVCSDKFDPLRALYAPSVPLPFPNVKCFNNVSEYESFLRGGRGRAKPENVEKRRRKAMKGVADPERIERLKKLMVNNPVPEAGEAGESSRSAPGRRRQKPQRNVLTRMPLCAGSPLGKLYQCVEERIRVKVHIRTFKGLRGVCSGFVVAFDKFWNMAMVDVDETYREPLLGEALYHEKALTISRLFEKLKLQENLACDEPSKKLDVQETASKPQLPADRTSKKEDRGTGSELSDTGKTKQDKVSQKDQGPQVCKKKETQMYGKVHTRHVNQLFIRGENVVLVNPQPL